VLQALADTGVPRIHFGVGTSELLALMGAAGAEVIGVDWRLPLAEASVRVRHRYALQGNLDPEVLSAPWSVLSERVRDVITSGAVAPGHVFNLGHGVPPDADPGVLAKVVELVHTEGAQLRREAREELAGASAAGGR
jgi:uroporphyrinogen decarboxylase